MTVLALEVAHLGPQNLLVEEVLRARGRAIARLCRGASAMLLSGALRALDPEPIIRTPFGPDPTEVLGAQPPC